MNIFKIKLLGAFFILAIVSCVAQQPTLDVSDIIAASSSRDEDYRDRDTRRKSTNRSRSRSSECKTDDCEEICEDIYEDGDDGDGVIERCLELSRKVIDTFETIMEYLYDPTLGNVRTVKEEYLDEFWDLVNVSLYPWIDIAEHASKDEAKALLTFVASSDEIAKALNDASGNYEGYEKYEGVKELLKQVTSSTSSTCAGATEICSCDRLLNGFCKVQISGNETFKSIVTAERNKHSRDVMINIILNDSNCKTGKTGITAIAFPSTIPHCGEISDSWWRATWN